MARAEVVGPLVELLYFDGCPHHPTAQALVERISAELGVAIEDVRRVRRTSRV